MNSDIGASIAEKRSYVASTNIDRFTANRQRKVADSYAADLLMPRYLFQPRAQALKDATFGSISQLAEAFKTSLTATAI